MRPPKKESREREQLVHCPTCHKPSWSPQVHVVVKKLGRVYFFWKYRHPRRYTGKDPETGLPKIHRTIWSCFVRMTPEEIARLRDDVEHQPDSVKRALRVLRP